MRQITRDRNGEWGGKPGGFTLLELLLCISIVAAMTGMALVLINDSAIEVEEKLVATELERIAEAVRRFNRDMGEPPAILAELMQSPDGSDNMGGWWWRDGMGIPQPQERLLKFDPATGRGWNGPYLRAEAYSTPERELAEKRIDLGGTDTEIKSTSTEPEPKKLAILVSDYSLAPQYIDRESDPHIMYSHYRLDYTGFDDIDRQELKIRFVRYAKIPKNPVGYEYVADIFREVGTGVRP